MNLQPFADAQLSDLMSWFPDRHSCQTWGGPEFRFPFTEATFREDAKLASLPTYALVEQGVLAGFGQYYLRLGRCHLARLAVSPALRGRGLGGELVRALCRAGTAGLGVESFSLFVLGDNERALRLYRRLGFSAVPYPEPMPGFAGCLYMIASSLDPPGRLAAAHPVGPPGS